MKPGDAFLDSDFSARAPAHPRRVVQALLKKAKKEAEGILVPGNHDEAIRQFIGLDFDGVLACAISARQRWWSMPPSLLRAKCSPVLPSGRRGLRTVPCQVHSC
jgi:hypothetical protein